MQDPTGRWGLDIEATSFRTAVTKDVARVTSLLDGDLPTSRWRTDSPAQALGMYIKGVTEQQMNDYLDGWRGLLDQENVTIGRTIGAKRTVVTARVESMSEPNRNGEECTFTALLRITSAYWQDPAATIVTLAAGTQDLTALDSSNAPITDCRLLIQGAATPLTAFSIADVNSNTGIAWVPPSVQVGAWLAAWGTPSTVSGAPVGQFSNPSGIALDSAGNVYVVDSNNKRVQKFTASGVFVSTFGSNGSTNGKFQIPFGIAVDSAGNIYVSDNVLNRVQKFDSTGAYVLQWGATGSANSQFNGAFGIALDAAGNVYVADSGNNRIQKFTSAGVYVSQFGTAGAANGQLNNPQWLAIDATGNIYVSEINNRRIQKFSSAFAYVTKWGSFGSANGQFANQGGIGLDAAGNVYVADTSNNRIQKFDSSGTFLAVWGSAGAGNGQMSNPVGLVVNSIADVFITDQVNGRVQKFDGDGVFDGIDAAHWLVIDIPTRKALIVAAADFDAPGDQVGGITTVPWVGDKLRLTPAASTDPLTRAINVTVTKTGGGIMQLRAKGAYL